MEEFKYRAIDNRPPPPHPPSATAFFSERSLGGAGGSAIMAAPLMSKREALQRELEKQRIRQEILAEEMARARRRELEEEVRRELALEGITLQRSLGSAERERGNLNSVAIDDNRPLPPQQKPRFLGLLNEIEPDNQLDPLQKRVNLHMNPKLNQVAIEDMPQPFIIGTAEIKPTNGQDGVIVLAKPDPAVYEAKRKAAEPAVSDSQFGLMKKAKKEWKCMLCGVNTTDQGGLNAHLRGRKHKAKEAAIGVENIGLDAKPDIKTHQALGEGSIIQNSGDTIVAMEGVKEEVIAQKSQNIGVSDINGVTAVEAGKTNVLPVLVGRNVKFWCDICKISTLSQVVMDGHKKGRKHRRRLEIVASQTNGTAPPTSSADNFSCSEKVHPISGSNEDNVGSKEDNLASKEDNVPSKEGNVGERLCAANSGLEKST